LQRRRDPAFECIEDRIEIVHRVTELVEAQMGIGPEAASGIEGVLLEEAADRLAAREEIFVTGMQRLAVAGEDRRLFRRRDMPARQLHRALAQGEAMLLIHEIRKDEESVAPEIGQLGL
jgi:hypothetical protein